MRGGDSRSRSNGWSAATAVALRIVALFAIFGIAVSCTRGPHASDGADRALAAAIAEIEAGPRTTPLIDQPAPGEDATATFLVRSTDGQAPRIVSDVTGWGESPDDSSFDLGIGSMTRIGSSDWYRLDAQVAPRARIEYLVVHGQTDYRIDPNNPRRAWTRGTDAVSELVTPDYVPPPELTDPPVTPVGRTVEATMDSRALGRPRRVLVYLPPGYRDGGAYPAAVFHAGWGVAHEGQAPRILDWMIAHGEIAPIVGLFLESYLPGEGTNHEGVPMRTFLTSEVPAWLRAKYRGVSSRADDWAVLAISYGAKDALDAALAPVGTYRRLGLLIPGRRLTGTDLQRFAQGNGPRLEVAILAGLYDQANLPTARAARRALSGAGHHVDFIEVPEGHNGTTWRNHLRDVLVSLFGGPDAASGRP
jgi:enterochelin esterase-like enzyme